MIVINGKEINEYRDYAKLTGEDLIAFMKNQPAEDVAAFKAFAAAPKVSVLEDGTEVERKTSFFELRNWVLDKYAPGIRTPQSRKNPTKTLLDEIADL